MGYPIKCTVAYKTTPFISNIAVEIININDKELYFHKHRPNSDPNGMEK